MGDWGEQCRELWGAVTLDSARGSLVRLGQAWWESWEMGHFTTAPLGVITALEWGGRLNPPYPAPPPPPHPPTHRSPGSEGQMSSQWDGGGGGGGRVVVEK